MKRTEETINLSSSKQGKVSKPSDDTCVSSKDENAPEGKSVKDVLKEKLLAKRHCASLNLKERTQLKEWCIYLKNLRYACDIISLTEKHSPLLYERNERCPDSALVVYPCQEHTYSEKTGPFQPVRLLIFADGSWRFQCTIYGFQELAKGQLNSTDSADLIALASRWFSSSHTLCPGLIGYEDVETKLGYAPKTVKYMADPIKSVHSVNCKVWHPPSSQARKDDSDPRWSRVCGECLKARSYIQRKLDHKLNLDEATRAQRQMPSSNYPVKFLSPGSAQKRRSKLRNERLLLKKAVRKYYKKTKIELPEDQSTELCKLIEAIEDSKQGKEELKNITIEGNEFKSENGNSSSGLILEEVWKKDRASFFKDQQRNGLCISLYSFLSLSLA